MCLGQHDCVTPVPTLPLSTQCEGKRREIKVDYICGQLKYSDLAMKCSSIYDFPVSCFQWSSYIRAKDCVDLALAHNGWERPDTLTNMTSAEKKTLLVSKLSFHYDGEVHSEFALVNRKVSSDAGSLCGLAAVYQAAVDTTFTLFQVIIFLAVCLPS